MTSHPSIAGKRAPPSLGFIGWGSESAALLSLLGKAFPGIETRGAWLATGMESGTEAPPLPHAAPAAEGLFREADLIFAEGGRAVLEPHLATMRLAISDRHVLVLLGGGWSLSELLEQLRERKLARVMVLPASQGSSGAVAYHAAPYFSPGEMEDFRALFAHVNPCIELSREAHFEVLWGLAEFAPAAFFTMMEALADGVVMMGIPRRSALQYMASLLHASAGRLLEENISAAQLREQALELEVAAAGLVELESAGVRGAVMRAIRAAVGHSRAKALADAIDRKQEREQ